MLHLDMQTIPIGILVIIDTASPHSQIAGTVHIGPLTLTAPMLSSKEAFQLQRGHQNITRDDFDVRSSGKNELAVDR
jgi:hypothetical protein